MQRLDKDLVADPSIYNLLLRLGPTQLDAAIYSVVSDNSFLHRSYPLRSPGRTPASMLEEAVYDNPLLLADFRRVYCIVETPRVMMIPSPLPDSPEDADIPRRLFAMQWPDFDGDVRVSPDGTTNSSVVWGLDRDTARFLARTFTPDLRLDAHLTPLVRYFAARPGRGNSARAIANLRQGSMDLIVLRGTRLLMANTFAFRTPDDARYYILASMQSLGLDPHLDELLLAGSQTLREQLSPMLREYVARVMPVIFPPQMFKAGMEALGAPFDMIVTPLCE